MRKGVAAAVKASVVVLAILAWTIAAHVALSDVEQPRAATLIACAPIAAAVLWSIRHSRWRILWILAIGLAVLAILMIAPVRSAGASFFYQFQYLAMQAVLAALFGRTLLAGREPLVTRFARIVHGTLPPPIERYTRSVTAAWSVFFAAMAAIAIALYALAAREVWSAFVNLLTVPCVAAMFGAEYAVRRVRFPDFEHVSILEGARAFQRAFASREPPP